MSSRSRYTSPLHARARFVAQRGSAQAAGLATGDRDRAGPRAPQGPQRTLRRGVQPRQPPRAPLILGALPAQAGPLRRGRGRRRLLLRRVVAQGPDLAVLQRLPGRPDRTARAHGLATSLLDDGVPLLLFPEGTRSRTGEMGNFKPGAAALCISRDVPCLPVAIVGAAEAMPYGQNWPTAAGRRCTSLRRADAGRGRRDGRPVLRADRQRGARPHRLRHDLPRQPRRERRAPQQS